MYRGVRKLKFQVTIKKEEGYCQRFSRRQLRKCTVGSKSSVFNFFPIVKLRLRTISKRCTFFSRRSMFDLSQFIIFLASTLILSLYTFTANSSSVGTWSQKIHQEFIITIIFRKNTLFRKNIHKCENQPKCNVN